MAIGMGISVELRTIRSMVDNQDERKCGKFPKRQSIDIADGLASSFLQSVDAERNGDRVIFDDADT